MKKTKRTLCLVILLGLMALTGCGQKPEPAAVAGSDGTPADGANQEINIYSDTQAGSPDIQASSPDVQAGSPDLQASSPDTRENVPDAEVSRNIIKDQSFDMKLEGWGEVRFVSCKPEDSLDTPHFYLSKDNQVLYTYPWEDRTGTPGVFDSVRFVSFPDLDKDGRKDVIIGVGKLFQNTDSRIPYSVISIYMNRDSGFETYDSLTDQVNEAVMYGEADYKEVAALVEGIMMKSANDKVPEATLKGAADDKVPEGIIQQAAGTWKLDGVKTEAGLRQYGSLQEMFGTGLQMGNELKISAAGELSYYIGISTNGEGQCTQSGGSIEVVVTPYEDHGRGKETLILHLVSEDDKQYVTMEYDGETLYWSR